MQDINSDLSEEEIDLLDRFLLDRIDEDADAEGKDEGIINISELDGFLTAVVSGPIMIPPSQWMPEVWGDFEPVWEDDDNFRNIMTLMMRQMNGIVCTLMDQPDEFEPMFMSNEVNGNAHTIVDEWCEGYMRGVALSASEWDAGGEEIMKLLLPIVAFTSASSWRGHDLSDDATEDLQEAIAPCVREIHAYWLERREEFDPALRSETIRRSEPRVGRNDPCPCGSGKKYKKCCLN